ncbi:Ferredoxin-dependent glutamate synthase [hydrothermal vent metagenome]|uniref:Ferredoxin-dependent glutamate synthase n=1 Tax=hydrothermal vent metagenome TaxID=652676 RepID=A0A3B0XFI0_9ZZZZ
MNENPFLMSTLEILAILFVTSVCVSIVAISIIYIIDRNQTVHAIRRNYPVIGRFRYWFEHLGTFFRQYFFTMDREELPFNRAERSWVYRASKNISNTVAFGSTRDLKPAGTVIFVNCPFPTLGKDAVKPKKVTIGASCQHPYTTASIFNISGMSYGALSKPAIISLSHGARKAGAWVNTGEGGLSPYHLDGGADIVYQIGTAKYGVRDENGELSDEKLQQIAAHEQVKMFEIKLSQGAKPGKGGILPGGKVTAEIAAIRGIPEGEDSISPNRHPDINSNDDLLNMIHRIRKVTGKPVGFKVVIGTSDWIDDMCQLILKRGLEFAPDFITIDSSTGGTGAAPMSLIDYVGLPVQESLPLVIDKLAKHKLRERIKIIASGKLITPAEVAWALCMGADFITSARGFMFALGCIQALQCDKNTCPTGITTHNKKLQRGLVHSQKSWRVTRYIENMIHEVGVIGHSCGVKTPSELNRHHARIIQTDGRSKSLNDLYPSTDISH